ncbi:MAG TPA: bifunctional precorrin-2 dehydrogenase/sirohydrochlorin ferrochelatase [Actinomycetota bacterium]|nr:bifunctional precorrin-2 dehydrogenase/sirohydrochlorin ferrochelatase [Actinomycetota bacterium]
MAFAYPVMLELRGRRAVVIGALAASEGKDLALREAGAEVTFLANGAWRPEDLEGAFLVVASSDDPAERDAIARAARERGVLVNVMDDVPNCDFAAPAIVHRGDLVIAVGTGGRSPAVAAKIRADLEDRYGAEWAEVLTIVGEVRAESVRSMPDLRERARRWRSALDVEEATSLVRAGRGDELRRRLRTRMQIATEPSVA